MTDSESERRARVSGRLEAVVDELLRGGTAQGEYAAVLRDEIRTLTQFLTYDEGTRQ